MAESRISLSARTCRARTPVTSRSPEGFLFSAQRPNQTPPFAKPRSPMDPQSTEGLAGAGGSAPTGTPGRGMDRLAGVEWFQPASRMLCRILAGGILSRFLWGFLSKSKPKLKNLSISYGDSLVNPSPNSEFGEFPMGIP